MLSSDKIPHKYKYSTRVVVAPGNWIRGQYIIFSQTNAQIYHEIKNAFYCPCLPEPFNYLCALVYYPVALCAQ